MRLNNREREMVLCLVEQNLYEFPWQITLSEFLRLQEIIKEDLEMRNKNNES